ncbi:glutathione S-transferase family protein [Rhizobium helianthi]|uniref:Glutathione S-transferase family protein n=1 Tax=Rhizobium helianthi TaxID=1132695 RepID=A0ABW4M558_9HYPH
MEKLFVTRGSGNCFKPFLVSCLTGRNIDIVNVDLLAVHHRSRTFLSINPLGRVPYLLLEDGDGIGESNAMLWLLAEGSKLLPGTVKDRARSLQWMFFEQTRLEPFISPARFLSHIAPDRGAGRGDEIAAWQGKAMAGLRIVNDHLQKSRFMLGDTFGITDIAIFGYVHLGHEAGIDMAAFPAVLAWIEQVQSLPGFQPLSMLCERASPFVREAA